jgi:hypothetical protein
VQQLLAGAGAFLVEHGLRAEYTVRMFRHVNRWRRRLPRSLGNGARWAVALACTLSLVFGAARAGSRYFFCSVMQQVRADACCHRATAPVAEIDVADCDCCKGHRVAALPQALLEVRGSTPPPAVSVLLPEPLQLSPMGVVGPQCWTPRAGAGPPRMTDHARLMVFLS